MKIKRKNVKWVYIGAFLFTSCCIFTAMFYIISELNF